MRVDGQILQRRASCRTSTIAASTPSKSWSIAFIVRHSQRSRLADAVETALDLGKGVMHVAHVDDQREEPSWKVDRFSQHYACDHCGRSFEPLNPHHFSFNSPLGWCPVCEGLGTQKGANPALLMRDPSLSLRQGPGLAGTGRRVTAEVADKTHLFLRFRGGDCASTAAFRSTRRSKNWIRRSNDSFHGTGDAWIRLATAGAPETAAGESRPKELAARHRSPSLSSTRE